MMRCCFLLCTTTQSFREWVVTGGWEVKGWEGKGWEFKGWEGKEKSHECNMAAMRF